MQLKCIIWISQPRKINEETNAWPSGNNTRTSTLPKLNRPHYFPVDDIANHKILISIVLLPLLLVMISQHQQCTALHSCMPRSQIIT